ncbi:hypothetical protein C0992_005611 [Termitomyces sp. T32_za158]|nr:hypothetical protein C0992_005611 [Termitomyces sp. T32_za158]
MARRAEESDMDCERYHVNIFVDRDMFVRFTGGGIGHQITRGATHALQKNMEKVYFSKDSDSDSEETDEELKNKLAKAVTGEEPGKFEEEEDLDEEDEDLGEGDSEDEEEEYFEESLGFGAL